MLLLCLGLSLMAAIGFSFARKFWSLHCKPLKYDGQARMDGKTVLITGASSGIGKVTAENLLSRGSRVIMACRNLTKARGAADEILAATGVDPKMVSIVQLDLIDLDSVRQCAKQILNTEPKLDVLINNAGLAVHPEKITKQGYNSVFGVNYVGPFLLTYLLLDLLKKSAPSRIINVSSMRHLVVKKAPDFSCQSNNSPSSICVKYPYLYGYALSKLAQIWHTKTLTEKLREYNVTANSLCPGYVSSEIWYSSGSPWSWVLHFMGWLSTKIGRTTHDGALTVIYMAVDPSLENISGCFFENVALSQMVSPLTKDKALSQKMWDISMDMCGLSKKSD